MMTVLEVAEETGLPVETVRRYLNQFSEFCPSRKEGRRKLYDDDVRMTVMMIRQCYDYGRGIAEIRDVLAQKVSPTLDAEIIEGEETAVTAPLPPEVEQMIQLLPKIHEVMEEQSERIGVLEREVAVRQGREEMLAEEIRHLRHDVEQSKILRVQTGEDARKMRGEIDQMGAEIERMRAEKKEGFWGWLRARFGGR